MNQIINSCSPNFQEFFIWSKKHLKAHNKKVIIHNSQSVINEGVKCGGLCFESVIKIAGKNKLFEEVYVHEFSHMQQNIQKSPLWENLESDNFWNYLNKGCLKIESWQTILDIIALERDCEKRAIQHSKNWKLFDNKLYAQRANAYLYFYHYVFLTNNWGNSCNIYNENLVKAMPDKLESLSSFQKINMDVMGLFHAHIDSKQSKKDKL